MTTTTLSPADQAALELCVRLYRDRSRQDRGHLEAMMEQSPWIEVAKFCAYSCQFRSLNLKVWQVAPCWADADSGGDAGRLLRRMLEAGVSRFHPDPMSELERRR